MESWKVPSILSIPLHCVRSTLSLASTCVISCLFFQIICWGFVRACFLHCTFACSTLYGPHPHKKNRSSSDFKPPPPNLSSKKHRSQPSKSDRESKEKESDESIRGLDSESDTTNSSLPHPPSIDLSDPNLLSFHRSRSNSPRKRFKLLFRASRDGFSSSEFHRRCDHKGPTVTIVEANDSVFGAFTNIPWDHDGRASDQIQMGKHSSTFAFFIKCNSQIWKKRLSAPHACLLAFLCFAKDACARLGSVWKLR